MEPGTLSEAQWREHFENWRAAGGPQKAYCDLHGLPPWTFSYWKRKLGYLPDRKRRRKTVGRELPGVVELKPSSSARTPLAEIAPEAPRFELRISDLFGLSVQVQFSGRRPRG